MILVLGGTEDGRNIAELFIKNNYEIYFSTFSEYGSILASYLPRANLIWGSLDKDKLNNLIVENKINVIIDATHPYASNISSLAMEVADQRNILYIRYEREQSYLIEHPLIHFADSIEMAGQIIARLGKRVLSTIGSKQLPQLTKFLAEYDCEIYARVLPEFSSIETCLKCGLLPKHIIAMQGPFSQEMNEIMFKDYKIDILLTKDSGIIGGTDNKIKAAINLSVPTVVLTRPKIQYKNLVSDFSQILKILGDEKC